MRNDPSPVTKKNRRAGLLIFAVVIGMAAMSYAAVPLYGMFCRATGFGGTTQVAIKAPAKTLDRIVTVKFSANVARGMPWRFAPQQREIAVKLGQKVTVKYNAENMGDKTVAGTAVYNVTPPKTGVYFKKIQCFCFSEQVLKPHGTVILPVTFFVDPALDKDRAMDDVTTITLSYTFFNEGSSGLDKSVEDFYNTTPASSGTKTAKAPAPSVR